MPQLSNVFNKCQQEIERCQRMAEGSVLPAEKERWLRLAAQWIEAASDAKAIAEAAGQPMGRFPIG